MSCMPTPPIGYRLIEDWNETPSAGAMFFNGAHWCLRGSRRPYDRSVIYAVPMGSLSNSEKPSGVDLIAAERQRQISAEGYTPDHDAEHISGELLTAAVCYLRIRCQNPWVKQTTSPEWPFEFAAWKPTADQVGNLVKAGALIAAEIDRLQAAESKHTTENASSSHSPDCNEPSCFGCYDVESV